MARCVGCVIRGNYPGGIGGWGQCVCESAGKAKRGKGINNGGPACGGNGCKAPEELGRCGGKEKERNERWFF